jgi:threonine-phosphate decarboxylase
MNALSHDPSPRHGGQLRQIASRYGIAVERLVDFSANINPAGPPLSVQSAILRALEKPSALTMYPDLDLVELKQAVATHNGIQPENIAVANGFVPLLEAAIRSLKIKRCLLPVPSFGEYRRTLENTGVAVIPFCLSHDGEFRYEIDEFVKALQDHSCDAILLANPQNPSGVLYEAEKMLRLIEVITQHRITLLLDEAFIDYCPSDSLTKESLEQAHVIVFRSVTKFFAVPGLRVAYAVSNSLITEAMNRSIAPWPITSFAADAVCAALKDGAYAEETRLVNAQRRLWLERELARLKIATYRSSANFLLSRFPATVDLTRLWERMIVEEQLVLRSCVNFEGLLPGHLRIAVRSESENEKLISGLARVLFGFDACDVGLLL